MKNTTKTTKNNSKTTKNNSKTTKNNSKTTKNNKNNKNNNKNTKIKHICYTGYGARKDGNHTRKQFLEIMNRSSKISWKKNSGHRYFCEAHLKALKCKSCKQKKNITKYQNRQMRKNPKYEPSKKVFSKQMRIISRCIRCADNNNETCNLKDFIKWSGAIIGKCDNI